MSRPGLPVVQSVGGGRDSSPCAGYVRMEGPRLSEAGWKAGPWAQVRAGVLATTGEVSWVGSSPSSWAWKERRNRKPGAISGAGVRCRAARPHLARRACGGFPPAPQGWTRLPRTLGFCGSPDCEVVGGQVRRGDVV